MRDWNLQSGSRKSTASEAPFADGQRVRSVLVLDGEEGLRRLDFHLEETVELGEARPVAQWIRVFRSNEAEREMAREAVNSAEELFFRLSDGEAGTPGDGETEEVRGVLRFLLALHLERKRVLRPVGRISEGGVQRYRHPKRGVEIEVAAVDLDGELVRKTEGHLDALLVQ
jgi:hypothetical protein